VSISHLAADGDWLDQQVLRLVANRRARTIQFRDEKAFRAAAINTPWLVVKLDGTRDERLIVRILEFVLNDPTRIEAIDDEQVTLTFAVCIECEKSGGRRR
jgi:hypothetical protein